jgi:DNA-binding PadR family transcriptional regulator
MSRGHGKIERAVLAIVGSKPLSTREIARLVSGLADAWYVTEAQRETVARALRKLKSECLVISRWEEPPLNGKVWRRS